MAKQSKPRDRARAALEAQVWKATHRDYRSMWQGERHVLVGGPQGTTLRALASMSVDELLKRM